MGRKWKHGLPFEEPKAGPDMEVLLCGVKNEPSSHDQDQLTFPRGYPIKTWMRRAFPSGWWPMERGQRKMMVLSWPSISCLNGQLTGVTVPLKTFKITGLNFLTGWITNSLWSGQEFRDGKNDLFSRSVKQDTNILFQFPNVKKVNNMYEECFTSCERKYLWRL